MQISTFFSSKYNKNRYTEEDLLYMVFRHSASTSHFAKWFNLFQRSLYNRKITKTLNDNDQANIYIKQ